MDRIKESHTGMYGIKQGLVLGFHGCDRLVAD